MLEIAFLCLAVPLTIFAMYMFLTAWPKDRLFCLFLCIVMCIYTTCLASIAWRNIND